MTTAALTAEERHAAQFAIVEDLIGLADHLKAEAEEFTNARIGQEDPTDVASAARMIGNLAAPLAELADAARQEVK